MTDTNQDPGYQSDASVEQLLRQAPPRPAPSADIAEQAKAAVKAEWLRVSQRRRQWRYAAAASVVGAAAALLMLFSAPTAPAIQVASIDKAHGTFSFLLDDGVLQRGDVQQSILAGQAIVTAGNSSLGLQWFDGGSLRLDANTSVRFTAADQIELLAGRIYFDSNAQDAALLIHTDYGDVRHLGTQFMTDVSSTDLLRVSVREGVVAIDGIFHEAQASVGEQVVLHGDRAPVVATLASYGKEWHWVETVAPSVDMKGKTFYQLLEWVSRETGLQFRFESKAAEDAAKEVLSGVAGTEPMVLLRVGALAAQLDVRQVNGVILISQQES